MTATLPALARPDQPLAPRPLTLRPAPRREPPFDDEAGIATSAARPAWSAVGAQLLPFENWPAPTPYPQHRRSWTGSGAPADSPRPDHAELPDPGGWARRLLVALLEARVGLRPVRQLSGYLSPAVASALTQELAQSPRPTGRPRPATVASIHVCEPADLVAEVSAVICTGARYRAIAARLEGQDERWRCVQLQFG